jgi:hypothetical protein
MNFEIVEVRTCIYVKGVIDNADVIVNAGVKAVLESRIEIEFQIRVTDG